MTYPIRIVGDSPIFLCEWNGGEIVEIHTAQTLREQYQGDALFDPEDDSWAWEIQELMTFDALLDHLETESLDKGKPFHNDNMTITRIR